MLKVDYYFSYRRATYEYERKIFTDHYESLQLMEKNYISMVREVEKLRAELANAANTAANTAANPGRSGMCCHLFTKD